jgi:hypothetical protein
MQDLDDPTLLREFSERNSEQAYATLVARHIDKVYSVPLRHRPLTEILAELTRRRVNIGCARRNSTCWCIFTITLL